MSTIEVVNHITLDGVMQAPAHPDEDRRGGFEQGGWAPPYSDEVQGQYMGARMSSGGGRLLLGRWTYEKFEDAWQKQPEDNPIRRVLEASTKYVVSRSHTQLGWQNSVLLEGDAVDTVADLKAREDGNIVILGSGELVGALLPHGLIDAFLLTIHPLVLGSGRRLFAGDGALAKFNLVESKPTTTGVLIVRYEAASGS
jgi:dihydrofolate reductase